MSEGLWLLWPQGFESCWGLRVVSSDLPPLRPFFNGVTTPSTRRADIQQPDSNRPGGIFSPRIKTSDHIGNSVWEPY